MKLNIYVGLRAIAYVITQGCEVIKHGIKKVNVTFDNYYEFIAGQPVSLRITRRQKRQARERGISPYEPDTIIPLEELFTDKYDLDHIVPKSKIFETGYANLVLCRKELNKLKNRKLASDFVKSDLGFTEEKWKEVAEKFGAKKQFLLMQEVPTDWISRRQNSDYNTKCFGTLAMVNIPNKLINKFAKEWQLQKYDEQNMLHYLYKAFVLANLDQSVIDKYDHIATISEKVYHHPQVVELPSDFESIIPYLPKPILTRKTNFGYHPAKQLHQETILGKRVIDGKTFYKVRQPLTKLSDRMLKNIYSDDIRIALGQWAEQHGGLEKAKETLAEQPFFFRGNPVGSVSVRMTDNDLPFLRHKTDDKIHSKTQDGKPVDFVYSETNYALEVTTDEKGKQQKRLITLLEHCDNLNGKKEPYNGTLWKMYDVVKYKEKLYFFIGCGETNQLRPVFDLNASECIKSFKYAELEKIEVNQLGV